MYKLFPGIQFNTIFFSFFQTRYGKYFPHYQNLYGNLLFFLDFFFSLDHDSNLYNNIVTIPGAVYVEKFFNGDCSRDTPSDTHVLVLGVNSGEYDKQCGPKKSFLYCHCTSFKRWERM